jgi:P2-related tail formation protein
MKRVYITKFALTKGILVADAVQVDKERVRVEVPNAPWLAQTFKLGEWHSDADLAIKRAAQLRDTKVSQLITQSSKLRDLEFAVPDLV